MKTMISDHAPAVMIIGRPVNQQDQFADRRQWEHRRHSDVSSHANSDAERSVLPGFSAHKKTAKYEFYCHAVRQISLAGSLQMKNGFPLDKLGQKIRYSPQKALGFISSEPTLLCHQLYSRAQWHLLLVSQTSFIQMHVENLCSIAWEN